MKRSREAGMPTHGQKKRSMHSLPLRGLLALCLPALALAQAPPAFNLTNAAGNGVAGFAGDSGKAPDAQLNYPMGLAIDNSGNVYIADHINHRIRKVASDGTITTVAGSDAQGSSGDDGPATSAKLNYPTGIAIDSSGALYITDTMNHVIRKVVVGGNITRVAGSAGVSGFLEKNAKDEFLDAKDAQLNAPTGIAIDAANNIYFCDTRNHRVRKIGADGKISTIAGNGTKGELGDGAAATDAELNSPTGVAVDPAGNVYIADQMNHRIRKVDKDGIISTVAGVGLPGYAGNGGLATSAKLFYPCCIALDKQGNLFIADRTNNRVRRVDAAAGTISLAAGNGRFGDDLDIDAAKARLRFPAGLAADSAGRVYFSDNANSRVKLLTPAADNPAGIQGPSILADGGVVSDPSFGGYTSIAPGAWIEIYGSNLALLAREWSAADFEDGRAPTSLEGSAVLIGGQRAYIASVSPTMIRALVPFGVGEGRQTVVVETPSGRSAPYSVAVEPLLPGILAPASLRAGGRQLTAAVLGGGGGYALPPGLAGDAPARPARPGDEVILYGAGFGPVTPFIDAGETARAANSLVAPLEVTIGGVPAEILSAGLAAGKVGLYEIHVRVPPGAGAGVVPLKVTVNGQPCRQDLYIAAGE